MAAPRLAIPLLHGISAFELGVFTALVPRSTNCRSRSDEAVLLRSNGHQRAQGPSNNLLGNASQEDMRNHQPSGRGSP
jgi:hypothetical protein